MNTGDILATNRTRRGAKEETGASWPPGEGGKRRHLPGYFQQQLVSGVLDQLLGVGVV